MKSRLLASLLLPLGTLVLASTALAATTWYVNGTSGSDSNACLSATTACKTIGHAISLAASGDTIRVAAGTYLETLTINSSLTLVGAGQRISVIGPANVPGPTVSVLGGNVAISKFTIRGAAEGAGAGASAGAGISFSGNGELVVLDTIVGGGRAAIGGGISSTGGGRLYIERSMLISNIASEGGGIYCTNPLSGPSSTVLRITNTAIVSNRAMFGNGGGIMSSCPTAIINSTIASNQAIYGSGGGYYATPVNSQGHYATNSTISLNYSSFSGGGVFGDVGFEDSIVAGNHVGNGVLGNCDEAEVSYGYNISDDDTCSFDRTGDLDNTNPMLGLLQFYDHQATMAIPISPGSPAIDAGNPNGCPIALPGYNPVGVLVNDQRGRPRPGDPKLKTGCDIGAYEYQFPR